ncbi:DUF4153 domain-containing protein [Nonomuraea sp. NPDC050556]|uniref:DUF4153 domain-containing protein n=1 Tax=Nonomuraea sp. NPDC050556 TaxID=3364369 RepID=UPI0037B3273C
MNPLDFLGRIKVKLGIVIVLAVAVGISVYQLVDLFPREVRLIIALALAMIMVQVLARGMTKPLREMARAAQTIAKGRYDLRVSATSRDEVGELARAFNAMAADLGEVDRQRRELVANVSHELRTPITGLRAVLENVVDGVSAPDPVTMRTALAQTERLGRLVAQLLDLSRLDSGVRLIEPETVSLGPLVEQAVREASMAREDVRITQHVPRDLAVRADPDLLAQVLANLLDNAVRHSPASGLVTMAGSAQGSGVRITVSDCGPGIPETARSRVFERFSRLDEGRTADSGGAGLGLAIVKEIVELHGGSIRIDDCAGCRMIVDLPERTVSVEAQQGEEEVITSSAADVPLAQIAPLVAEPASVPSGGLDEPEAHAARVEVREVEGNAVETPAPAFAMSQGGPPPEPGLTRAPWPIDPPVEPEISYARMFGGGVIGGVLGFIFGLLAAVFASIAFGGAIALLTLLACSCGGMALGAYVARNMQRRQYQPIPYTRPVPYGPQPPPGHPAAAQGYGPPPAYVPPPLFPRPELPDTPRWLLPAAAGAGVFCAVALPYAQTGLGFVLVALVLGAAALPAVLRRMTPWTVAFGLAAYWLISMAVIRDADWLVSLMLLAGFGLGALAVSGAGAGWLGVIRGGMSVLLSLAPVPWFIAAPLKNLAAKRRILPLLGGVAITIVLLVVFGVLFASADAVFESYVNRLLTAPEWAESVPVRVFLFLVGALFLAAVVLVALRPVNDPIGPSMKARVSTSVWMVPLTAVNLLFAAFVAVQIRFLFGGNEQVLHTRGLTYAEYARQGFFQLVVVSVVVLGIVTLAGGVLKVGRRERWVLSGQLGILCGLTMVILFSALHRMDLYTDAYGLSRLRLSVQATVWWLGALFALVLLAGAVRLAGRSAAWLPRTVVLVTALGLGTFSMVNPDYLVAATQVDVRGIDRLDADYLGDLGAEAVPALDRLPEPQRSCVLADVVSANGLDKPDAWNGWNLARSRAREVLAEHLVLGKVACPLTRSQD